MYRDIPNSHQIPPSTTTPWASLRTIFAQAFLCDRQSTRYLPNHPSGDPTPSKADVETTREVAKAAALLGVTLHDHIIIGRGRHVSLKSLGLF
ncbi:MAG: hypothetical protein JO010_13685 [Alphaproteobacteria bacterium]|nr:hypothetical protein [Alphaproteobacteria bacterium]